MKGTFFNKPLEWTIEVQGESWHQGASIQGKLTVKNHGAESLSLARAGVALAHADIKKVHSKAEGALKIQTEQLLTETEIAPAATRELNFTLKLNENCPITDKKGSYFLVYGRELNENHLMLKINPRPLFEKVIGLMDTFFRFKIKEIKSAQNGTEYKLIPPTSRDMANIEGLVLNFSMSDTILNLDFDFQVKKIDISSVTTKINKETLKIKREISQKDYSLGRDMINQDQLLKILESVISEVKMKNVF